MNTPSSSVGRLYVVATPIGNLADLSPRAAQILAQVALIACEDTRHSQVLLRAIGVNTPLTALHDHNESTKLNPLLERLQQGQDVALISDAGTPLISDPGFKLIQAAALRQIEIIAVPGPSAVTAALSIAGLPTDRFVFEGFLPAQDAALKNRLGDLRHEPRTMVFYEAPHRIKNTLKIAAECFGSHRPAALLRELTKRHETVVRAPLQALATLADSDANMARGEQVLVIQGAEPMDALAATPAWHAALELFLTQLSVRTAVDWVCELYAVKRNEVYERALALKQSGAVSDTNA